MFRALRSEDLPAGEGIETQIRRVRTEWGHVMLARLGDGRVVAFTPSCPHQATDLDDATLWDGNLRCPRHSYLYQAQSGENIVPTRDTPPENMWKLRPGYLPCYQVSERDGWIWVADQANPPPASWDPALEQVPERRRVTSPATVTTTVSTAAAEQSVKFLNVASGSTFELRLPTTPREGYAWRFEVVGDLLRVTDQQFEPGDMPCHRILVAADGAGAATLTCTYASNAAGQRAEVRIYIVRAG